MLEYIYIEEIALENGVDVHILKDIIIMNNNTGQIQSLMELSDSTESTVTESDDLGVMVEYYSPGKLFFVTKMQYITPFRYTFITHLREHLLGNIFVI